MNNPIDMIKQMIGANGNPQEFIMNKLINNINNPLIDNLVGMAKKGNSKGIETFARNICRERGINFDEEFQNFIRNFKR